MYKASVILTGVFLFCLAAGRAASDENILRVNLDGKDLIHYQAGPIANPKGGASFKGSNFIHPLKTPSGFVVTDCQPPDHLHHFGLWWPWKYIVIDGRKVLCWELQKGDGMVEAKSSKATPEGFSATSVYTDRKAPGGPQTLIRETLNVKTSSLVEQPARGYSLDLEIIHEVAVDQPITIQKYRYSGFALRGTAKWNRQNSTVITSEGKDYRESNLSRARWVKIEGHGTEDNPAGVLMMSHPDNRDHPERLRTWNPQTQNGAVFVNFNTVQETSWVMQPGKRYTRHFRLFVYDGELSVKQAEILWEAYRQL